jgi:hypothetical protein
LGSLLISSFVAGQRNANSKERVQQVKSTNSVLGLHLKRPSKIMCDLFRASEPEK